MFKNLAKAALLCLPLMLISAKGCSDPFTVTSGQLKPGGVFVTYVQGTDCTGCEALERADLILKIDGKEVSTADDVEAAGLLDGQPHEIEFHQHKTGEVKTTTITAKPNETLAPIKPEEAMPFWTVGSDELDRAPSWARRRLFGHASPQLLLVSVDGGFVNGRDFHGKKHLVVFFDWAAASDRQDGALVMQVLQKAQADLDAAGVDIVFAQVKHPSERERQPMNDTDLRAFFNDNQVSESEGGPLPPPPMFRMPNKTEYNPTQVLGLEGAFTYYEAIGEAPNIFVLDENGIIRWHSAGTTPDPSGEIPNETVHTINAAVLFALKEL